MYTKEAKQLLFLLVAMGIGLFLWASWAPAEAAGHCRSVDTAHTYSMRHSPPDTLWVDAEPQFAREVIQWAVLKGHAPPADYDNVRIYRARSIRLAGLGFSYKGCAVWFVALKEDDWIEFTNGRRV